MTKVHDYEAIFGNVLAACEQGDVQRAAEFFAEDALKSVASRAIQRKTGARGLRSIMEQILLNTMFDLPGLDGVEEVVINREVAESRANPLYIHGKERAESSA